MFPYGQQITLVSRIESGQDGDGNTVYEETLSVVTGAFAPGSSSELVQGQDTMLQHPAVYLPAGTDVSAVDAVEVDGLRYEVDGQPLDWRNPFTGWNPGIEVRLLRVTG